MNPFDGGKACLCTLSRNCVVKCCRSARLTKLLIIGGEPDDLLLTVLAVGISASARQRVHYTVGVQEEGKIHSAKKHKFCCMTRKHARAFASVESALMLQKPRALLFVTEGPLTHRRAHAGIC